VVEPSLIKLNLSNRGLDPRIHLFNKCTAPAKPGPTHIRQRTKNKQESGMPEITISMAAGRTDDQKAGMMRDITQALVKNLGVDADAVVIQINEAPLAHKMKGGKTFVERAAAKK
jgi:4-oxalocrotonate tautomerase